MKTDDTGRPTFRTYQERGTDIDTRRMGMKQQTLSVAKADVTLSRAINGTIYQNAGDKIILTTITIEFNNGLVTFYCDASPTPTEIVGQPYSAGHEQPPFTFIVPPWHYYRGISWGTAFLYKWIEWTMS